MRLFVSYLYSFFMNSHSAPPRRTFFELLQSAQADSRPVILDGATGTELDNRGADTSSPLWSGMAALADPDLLRAVHRDYVAAGAEVITANTFRTTRWAFLRSGVDGELWSEAVAAAVAIAREAAGDTALVAGSVAPIEDCFLPDKAPGYDAAVEAHTLLCRALVSAGVDILWLETFGTLAELRGAIDAACAAGCDKVPFCVSVTTTAAGDLISGEPLRDAVHLAASAGAAAFSINCIPTGHVPPALAQLLGNTTLPVGVYANLGVPEVHQDWRGSAYLAPEAYAELTTHWAVAMVGGCCGSTPAHIAALAGIYR